MNLIAPNGIRVSVSDAKGEVLRKQGYKSVEAVSAASTAGPVSEPVQSPKTRRPRARKTES